MYNSSEASFTLHNDVGNAHLAAQGGEEDDELDGVNVMRDDDEGGFLGFNEGDDVVEAVFDKEGFLGVLFITMSEVKVANKTAKEGTLASFSFSSATEAAAVKRAFFSCFDSGRYSFNSLNNCVAVFLSRVCENWAMAGGTLRRWCRMTFAFGGGRIRAI